MSDRFSFADWVRIRHKDFIGVISTIHPDGTASVDVRGKLSAASDVCCTVQVSDLELLFSEQRRVPKEDAKRQKRKVNSEFHPSSDSLGRSEDLSREEKRQLSKSEEKKSWLKKFTNKIKERDTEIADALLEVLIARIEEKDKQVEDVVKRFVRKLQFVFKDYFENLNVQSEVPKEGYEGHSWGSEAATDMELDSMRNNAELVSLTLLDDAGQAPRKLLITDDRHPCHKQNLFDSKFSKMASFPTDQEAKAECTLGYAGAETQSVVVRRMTPEGKDRFQAIHSSLCRLGLGHRLEEPVALIPFRPDGPGEGAAGGFVLGAFKRPHQTKTLEEFVRDLGPWTPAGRPAGAGADCRAADLTVGVLVLKDLLRAVAALHRHGVMHRGLNPASVLVDSEHRVLLAGLDRAGSGRYAEGESMSVRSDSYRAPPAAAAAAAAAGRPERECFLPPPARGVDRADSEVDCRLPDQYACGVLVHYVLARRAPDAPWPPPDPAYNLADYDADMPACVAAAGRLMPRLGCALARDLAARLTGCDPQDYTLRQARSHPLLWDPAHRMDFLREVPPTLSPSIALSLSLPFPLSLPLSLSRSRARSLPLPPSGPARGEKNL